ncbi:MAG TPA: heat-inducible transcriptional repressor HrcA [Acidimicrobiia bacterium]|nr:heat-inducible transcriptional repressor HrcA [Acidimicrobiia bacterium]
MLDERKAAILAALVEHYIDSGAPVSSRTILDLSGLDCSSATIRNELVVLEHEGFVSKPHTSAGRVPTNRGYRYYIDHLSPGLLRDSTRGRIEQFFATFHSEFGRVLRETSDLLSEITAYPAVVLGPGLRDQTVRDVHLVGVEPGVVLLVLVAEGGRVHQSIVRCPVPVTPAEVGDAADALTEALVGATMPAALEGLDFGGLEPPTRSLVARALEAVEGAAEAGREIYVGGASRMVELWEDLAKLHRVLGLLEREATVLELLDESAEGTTVRLGPELPAGEEDLAVVSAPYAAGRSRGRMGVLGPMRMDYRRTIRVVEEVSEALGDSLAH